MGNAYASALEISAKIIRENLKTPSMAATLITEKIHAISDQECADNSYIQDYKIGFQTALRGLYELT